ncbi:hypothetical protein [Neobacillus piezotolerans]|nr:hypothetical protein [Neobacillus piezotolerans]
MNDLRLIVEIEGSEDSFKIIIVDIIKRSRLDYLKDYFKGDE